jgi:hypothetical protein
MQPRVLLDGLAMPDRLERRDPMTGTNELADRYISLWNEPDRERRRQLVAELWTEDGAQILQPPQEMREIAARPGIGMSATLEARGHAALEARTTSAYDGWVAGEGFHFRRRDNVDRLQTSSSSIGRRCPPTARSPASGSRSSSSTRMAASGSAQFIES